MKCIMSGLHIRLCYDVIISEEIVLPHTWYMYNMSIISTQKPHNFSVGNHVTLFDNKMSMIMADVGENKGKFHIFRFTIIFLKYLMFTIACSIVFRFYRCAAWNDACIGLFSYSVTNVESANIWHKIKGNRGQDYSKYTLSSLIPCRGDSYC